jgi:hypothetical protein
MIVTRCTSGAWEISSMHKDVLVSRCYIGHTKTESIQMFRDLLRSITHRTYVVYDYNGNQRRISAANIAHAKRIAKVAWGERCNVYPQD